MQLQNHISNSDADAVIIGGDFNAQPDTVPGQANPYEIISYVTTNSAKEIYPEDYKDTTKFATYGNRRNGHSNSHSNDPIIYDYIFHKR